MRSMRKSLALLLAAGTLFMAGCGGSKTETPKDTTPAPAADTKPKDPVKISFWHGMASDSVHGKTITQLVKQFNESQKDVIVEEVYQGNYTQLDQKVTSAVAGGTPPTVVQVTDSILTSYVQQKIVAPLDSYLSATDKNDIPAAFTAAQTFDGKLMAVPFNKSMIVLFYNKKLVPTPPKTWEEFRTIAKQVTVPGKTYGTAFLADNYYFGNHLIQAGGDWIKDGQLAFNSDAGVQALQFLVDMIKEGSALQLKPNEYQSNIFNEGRAAMVETTTASLAYIKPANGDPWGVAPLPAGPKNDLTGLSGANLVLMQGLKPEEAAAGAKFINFMISKEATLTWAMAKTGYMPIRKSAVEDAKWQDFVKANPEYQVMTLMINKGTAQPNHTQWSKIQKDITSAVESAILGKASAKEALDGVVKADNDLLKK